MEGLVSRVSYRDSFEYDLNNSEAGNMIHNKYNLLNEIHRSDHSIIIKISCFESGLLFVLKVVKKRDDLIFELDMLKQINVYGINQIKEIYESEQFVYFIESYIDGSNLEKYVHDNGAFEKEEAKVIVLKIAIILNRLHKFGEKNIVFRDLKPSNIMIETNGNITLIDVITIRETKDSQTQDTFLIGSKGYTAPEAYGFMQTSSVSDIYSLGATFFFLLTGIQPANVSSFDKYFDENREIPFDDIIKKATAFTPVDRFQSVDAFISALNYGRIKKSHKKFFFIIATVILVSFLYLSYLRLNKPFDVGKISQMEDIEMDSMAVLDNKDFKFELYSDGLLKIYVNKESLTQKISDFMFITVGTGYTPFSSNMISNDVFVATTEKGYQFYTDEGFSSLLDDRKSIMIILFSEEGEPIAYYTSNDVTQYAKKISFNELNTELVPADTFEVDDGVIFNNYVEYTVLKIDRDKVKSFSKVSIWNKHSPYAGKDIAKVQERIENGENIVSYNEEGINTDYGISGTFFGDYWLIYLLDENNNIVSEYRTESLYQISQPSLQIEKSIDLDDGVIIHVLGTYAKIEVDRSKVQNVKYVGMFQQRDRMTDQEKEMYRNTAKAGESTYEYTKQGVDIGYDESGLFDDSSWYIIFLDENKNVIKEYSIE